MPPCRALTGQLPARKRWTIFFELRCVAADHGLLRPWRFLTIQGESLHRLGNLFAAVAEHDNPEMNPNELDKVRRKPLRAPLIVVVISSPREHPKVPVFEQDLSAAAATQNMLVAAFAQGLGAMWRTGSMAYHPQVKQGLGLQTDEKIIGFLYLGEAAAPGKR